MQPSPQRQFCQKKVLAQMNNGPEIGEGDYLQQVDELEALESIFNEEFSVINPNDRCYKISFSSNNIPVSLRFTLVKGYPSENPPVYEISAPSLPKNQRKNLLHTLAELCQSSIGSVMIYSMVETIRSFLDELPNLTPLSTSARPEVTEGARLQLPSSAMSVVSVPSVRDHLAVCGNRLPISVGVPCPQIYHGDVITDRKSVFQAHCCEVTSLAEVSAFISTMLEDRKVAAATHNITAWLLHLSRGPSPTSSAVSLAADYDDDGEMQAGGRLLHLITLSARPGVAVMVSRWYGGIRLGSDRFKHINNAASQLLIRQGLTKNSSDASASQTKAEGKKKRKR